MANRRPLVLVSGIRKELPTADQLLAELLRVGSTYPYIGLDGTNGSLTAYDSGGALAYQFTASQGFLAQLLELGSDPAVSGVGSIIKMWTGTTAPSQQSDRFKLWIADLAAGDCRLYLQGETGNSIILGNGEIRATTGRFTTSISVPTILNGAATLTLPTTTDTLVGRGTTDTLTNKQLTLPGITSIGKGGLLAGSGTNFTALLAAGTLGQLLIADPAQTAGMQWSSLPMKGLLKGLTLSNNATDVTNDIDIAAGCAWDNANNALMVLGTGITKRLDAAWAVGTNQGGLDTGSKASATGYHLWLIMRSDTGVVDVLFSTSPTAPTMPTNYDRKRRIGWVRTTGASALRTFTQVGDYFTWTPGGSQDLTTIALGTSDLTTTLLCPSGVKTQMLLQVTVSNATAGTMVWIRDPDIATSFTPVFNGYPLSTITVNVAGQSNSGVVIVWTNTSSQILSIASAASTILRIVGVGWWDRRGQDDYT